MRWWHAVSLRLRSVFRQSRADAELGAGLQFHLDQQTQEYLGTGMTPDAAHAAAPRALGERDQIVEVRRVARAVTAVQDLVRDMGYAIRVLRKAPVFTTVAVLTLGLGIGATTAIFGVVNGVLLKPLRYRDASRIVSVGTRWTDTGRQTSRLTGGDLLDLRASRQAFEAFSTYWGGEIGVQVEGKGEFLGVQFVEPSFFGVFDVVPVQGRTFVDADGEQRAVLGEGFAERVFGSPDRALGRVVSVEGQQYEIAGVLPRTFTAPDRTDLWLPIPMPLPRLALNRTAFNFRAVARLASGISLRQAQAHIDALGNRLSAAFPDSNRRRAFSVTPLRDRLVSPIRPTLYILLGAVFLVLVIACVNVAGLLIARSTTRSHELALRTALGAGRWRIVRQLAAESLVLAAIGGVLGVALAYVGTAALLRVAPETLPRLGEVAVDWRVLTFAGAMSLGASLVFGLAPAWQVSRVDPQEGLRQVSSRGLVGSHSTRLRGTLIIGEIALSLVLALGAGLLVRSFLALNAVDLGYRAESVLVMYAHAPAKGLTEYVQTARFFETLAPQLSSLPGVRAVAAVMGLPTGTYGSSGSFWIEGRPPRAGSQTQPEAGFRLASPGYFATLGVPIVRGRDFGERDRYDAPFVAIVSRSLAERDFPGQDPVGHRIRCGLDSDAWMTIVGIVGGMRQDSPGSAPGAEIYMPLEQHPYHANEVQVVVRTSVTPESLVPALREKMRVLNPAMAIKFTTLETMVSRSIDTQRFRASLAAAFAGLALLLAMAGVYGVMAYLTAQRTQEFGLRLALGAGRGKVFRTVLANAGTLAVAGVALGLVLSVATGRLMTSMLFGLTALDAPTYAGAVLLLSVVVLLGAAVPAWQASRVDPMTALRRE
ncbi:MAG TPA: ABC transporter permease [Vicinamibacterales bacterium]|jgi:predicted permease